MNRITKWIQERRAYSNPVFGAMLIVSATIFPVFQASARIAEPVQPMALNGEDVVDALNAVEAGVSVDEAFNIQPVPFRDFVKFHATMYNTLFDDAFDISNAGYYLDDEINEGDVFFDFIGSTIVGNEFIIRFASLTDVDLTGGSLTPDDIASLAEHDSNILSFVGTMSTAEATINIAGLVWQGTRLDDNERVRFLFILDTVNQSFIDDLEWVYSHPQFVIGDPGPAIDCAQAIVNAANQQVADWKDAIGDYNLCVKNMNNKLIGDLADCTAINIGGTFLIRWVAPLATLVTSGTCAIVATARAQLALNSCFDEYENTTAAIVRAYNRAVQAARDQFGDDCPDVPA